MSDSLWPDGLQPTRPPCPSPTLRAYSHSCPSSQRCHPAISSYRPLLPLPLFFPGIRVFSSESALCIHGPKYWSFSRRGFRSPSPWQGNLLCPPSPWWASLLAWFYLWSLELWWRELWSGGRSAQVKKEGTMLWLQVVMVPRALTCLSWILNGEAVVLGTEWCGILIPPLNCDLKIWLLFLQKSPECVGVPISITWSGGGLAHPRPPWPFLTLACVLCPDGPSWCSRGWAGLGCLHLWFNLISTQV